MNRQDQTIETQFMITGMIPAEPGIFAVYDAGNGKKLQTPVLAWGTWTVRQTTRDRLDTPKVESFQQSGPIVYAWEGGLCPAPFVTGLPSLQGEAHRYLGVQPESGPADPLWAPSLIGRDIKPQSTTAAD